MAKSIFDQARCPESLSAEHDILNLIGTDNVKIVYIDGDRNRISEAEKAGVKSVPASLTPIRKILHIKFGASMADVKS